MNFLRRTAGICARYADKTELVVSFLKDVWYSGGGVKARLMFKDNCIIWSLFFVFYLYRPCKYSRTLKEFTPNLCPFPFGSSFGDFRGRRVCLHFSIMEAAGPRPVIWSKVLQLKENWSFQSWRRLSAEGWNIFRKLKEVHLPSTWITETLHGHTYIFIQILFLNFNFMLCALS